MWAQVSEKFDYGEIRAEVAWAINDTGGDALRGLVSFTPNSAAPTCERLSFIQTARVRVDADTDYPWEMGSGQSHRTIIKTVAAPGIEGGFFIDHDAGRCRPEMLCSPFYRDSWPNSDESADGASTEVEKKTATLFDAPFGWESFESIELEACAICQNPGSLEVLACAHWGGRWPLTSERYILPMTMARRASPTFDDALRRFFNFYGTAP